MSKNAVPSVLVVAIFAPTMLNSAEIRAGQDLGSCGSYPELSTATERRSIDCWHPAPESRNTRSMSLHQCRSFLLGSDANRPGPAFSLYIEGAGSATAGSRDGRRSLFGDDRLGNDAKVDQIASVEFEGRYGMIFAYELGAGSNSQRVLT
jgi:hypothetical protein